MRIPVLMSMILILLAVPILGEICYQETANETSSHPSCSGIITYNNGSYLAGTPGGWDDATEHLLFDGDYSTGTTSGADANDNSFYSVYGVPNITGVQTFNSAIWQVKFTDGASNVTRNETIPDGCIGGYAPGVVRMKWDIIVGNTPESNDYIRLRCFTSPTTQTQFYQSPSVARGTLYGFEEGIYWDITPILSRTHYNITTCADLFNVSYDLDGYWHLKNDVDCRGYNHSSVRAVPGTFTGVLDGENNSIQNLDLSQDLAQNTGIFQVFSGSVNNLVLINISVGGSDGEGGIGSQTCGILASKTLLGASADQVGIRDSYIACAYAVGGFFGDVNGGTYVTNSYIKDTEVRKLRDNADNHHGGIAGYSTSDLYTGWVFSTITASIESSGSNIYSIAGEIGSANNTIWSNTTAPKGNGITIESDIYEMRDADSGLWDNFSSEIWNVTDGALPHFLWENFTIFNPAPVINYNSIIADGVYYDLSIGNTTIEYQIEEWFFNVTIESPEPTIDSVTLSNSSGVFFTSSRVNDSMNFSGLNFLFMGNFTMSVTSEDIYGNSTTEDLNFSVIDSIYPECLGLGDVKIVNNTNTTIEIICVDEVLYTFNYTCSDSFTDEHIGLVPMYQLQYSDIFNNNVICSWEVCDGHTKKDIDDMDVKKDKLDTISFDGLDIYSRTKVKDIKYQKHRDKYSFTFEYQNSEDQIVLEVPPECYYSGSGKYQGWFLCPDTYTWIDFEGDHDVTINGNAVYVSAKDKDKGSKKSYEFQSIGKFNCISGSKLIETYLPAEGFEGFGRFIEAQTCPLDETFSYQFGYYFLLLAVLGIFIANVLYIKLPIFGIFIGFIFVGLTIPFYWCSELAGLVFTIFGLVLVVVELMTT